MSEIVYHGSKMSVEFPEVRKEKYTKDFSWGFYCTKSEQQAQRWAKRHNELAVVNYYSYEAKANLNILSFPKMSDKWLDFVAHCRNGGLHEYDIVEGPMADDQIWNYVEGFFDGELTRDEFWRRAEFAHPTHQISFHTIRALDCLTFLEGRSI